MIWILFVILVHLQCQITEMSMAKMYIRMPHYVASFYRNLDKRNPIPYGEAVDVEKTPALWNILLHGLVPNNKNDVEKDGCFSERLWRKMLHGQGLVSDANGKPLQIKRSVKDPLTIEEIHLLCGWDAEKATDNDEYLCVKLPQYIYRDGKQVIIDGAYQLHKNEIHAFCAEMRRCFWSECIDYIDTYVDATKANGYDRSKIEGLERFMLRYDIRNGEDNRTLATLKRNYYRQIIRRNHKQYDYEEFGEI